MALGVPGNPYGTLLDSLPEELESEFVTSSIEVLLRFFMRYEKLPLVLVGLALVYDRALSLGRRLLENSSGCGIGGAEGRRARERRRASSSAAANSFLVLSAFA